jgi:hypothetical protein
VVWWLRAEQPETLRADLAGLAVALGLAEAEADETDAISAAQKWLEVNSRWLLVFDNAPGPDAIAGLLPGGSGGHVLITSRTHADWPALHTPRLALDVSQPGESRRFSAQRTGQREALWIAKVTAVVVTFAATMTGLIFGLWPSLTPTEPPATKRATLSNATVDHVSYGQYLERAGFSRSSHRPAQLKPRGVLVAFDLNVKGYLNERLPLHWQLIDVPTGDQLNESRDLFYVPKAPRTTKTTYRSGCPFHAAAPAGSSSRLSRVKESARLARWRCDGRVG